MKITLKMLSLNAFLFTNMLRSIGAVVTAMLIIADLMLYSYSILNKANHDGQTLTVKISDGFGFPSLPYNPDISFSCTPGGGAFY